MEKDQDVIRKRRIQEISCHQPLASVLEGMDITQGQDSVNCDLQAKPDPPHFVKKIFSWNIECTFVYLLSIAAFMLQ